MPIVHLVTAYRDREEILSNPYRALQSGRPGSTRSAIAEHNLIGLPGLELMPGVHADGDVVIDTKSGTTASSARISTSCCARWGAGRC